MYLSWNKKIITDFSEKNIETLYSQGYVFTRLGRGQMDQTRSIRVDLNKFSLSSENRRVLKKGELINLNTHPLPYTEYDWAIGKLGKDFYEKKFGDKIFSANKIKSLLIEPEKNNFNLLLQYSDLGFCICFQTKNILHYSYPFYNLSDANKDLGMIMMTKAIIWAKENNKKYIYLGSASRATDTYKLQFAGLEWYDGKNWTTNLDDLKEILVKK